jgi:hypothetical protein
MAELIDPPSDFYPDPRLESLFFTNTRQVKIIGAPGVLGRQLFFALDRGAFVAIVDQVATLDDDETRVAEGYPYPIRINIFLWRAPGELIPILTDHQDILESVTFHLSPRSVGASS